MKTRLQYLFALVFLANFFFCQDPNAVKDSLLAVLKKQGQDTNRVTTLNWLSTELKTKDAAGALKTARTALGLANKLKFTKGKIQASINVGAAYVNLEKGDSALLFLRNEIPDCLNSNNTEELSRIYHYMADAYKIKSDLYNAIEFINRAKAIRIKVLKTSKDQKKITYNKKALTSAYNTAGTFYRLQGNFPLALENMYAALRLKEELNDQKGVASSSNNLGNIFIQLKNFPKALEFYNRALKINLQTGNLNWASNNILNIANVHIALGDSAFAKGEQEKCETIYYDALKEFEKGKKIKEELDDKHGIASALGNIGNLREKIGGLLLERKKQEEAFVQFDLARTYLDSSLVIYRQTNNLLGTAGSLQNLGVLHQRLSDITLLKPARKKNLLQAKKLFEESLELSTKADALEDMQQSNKSISEVCEALGEEKNAFIYYKAYIKLTDSLTNEEATKKETQSQMQYDFDKRSAADSIKNSEAKKLEEVKHQQEISKQRTFTYGGIAGFLVMIVVAGISFIAFRNKKKANAEITRQKHLVEEKQKEILDSIYYARRIQRALITNEKYFEKNLKRLKNTKA